MPVTPSPTRYVSAPRFVKTWLQTVVGYEYVLTRRPPPNLAFLMPLIVVSRVGGADDILTVDNPNLDIDVYAADEDGAEDQAEHIRRAMRKLLPGYAAGGTTVLRVETVSAPQLLPYDSRNLIHRAGATYRLRMHQYAGL